jgi:hypothetical protein
MERNKKVKKKESSLFRTVMVVGTAVMLIIIAVDVYRMKQNEAATLAQSSMAVVQTESPLDVLVKESVAPDSAKAAVMLQGMQVRSCTSLLQSPEKIP